MTPLKLKFLLSTLFFLFLMSCATTYKIGTTFNVENISKIKIGVTTQEEAIALFGIPLRKGATNKTTIFTYAKEEISFTAGDQVKRKGDTLVLEFDENKVLNNYYWNVPGKEFVSLNYFLNKRNQEKSQERNQQAAAAQQHRTRI